MSDPVFTIRLAVPTDAPRCAEIHRRSWSFAYRNFLSPDVIEAHNAKRDELWKRMLKDNADTHYAVCFGETVIGILSLTKPRDNDLPATVYEMMGLYLDPDFIRKGFGRKTVEWAKKEALRRGFDTLLLFVLDENERAKGAYAACGFRFDGTVKPSGLGETTEVRMLCPLTKG